MRVFVYPVTVNTHRDSFDLFLAGDFHYGAATCDEKAIHRFIDAVVENNKTRTTRVILMGDMVDCVPKLDRRNWGRKLRPDMMMLYTEFRDLIEPISRNVVACLVGNHDEDWQKWEDTDPANWLCQELKMPYATYESFIRFKIHRKGLRFHRNVDVVAWHGAGGGRTAGGAFNAARRPIDSFRTPSIVAMGHLHRLGVLHEQYMTINEKTREVISDDQYFCLTGGFLKGYEPPDSTYISRKMLPPVAIGALKLTIQPFASYGGGETDILKIKFEEIN